MNLKIRILLIAQPVCILAHQFPIVFVSLLSSLVRLLSTLLSPLRLYLSRGSFLNKNAHKSARRADIG